MIYIRKKILVNERTTERYMKSHQGCRIAFSVLVVVFCMFIGCNKKNAQFDQQSYLLTIGNDIEFNVDYGTRNLVPDSTTYQVAIRFVNNDTNTLLAIDCLRLGGGSIQGKFQAYAKETAGEQGEFGCLYQHTEEIILNRNADTVKISNIHFVHIIE